jgi:iron complex outermembrane receptor protein
MNKEKKGAPLSGAFTTVFAAAALAPNLAAAQEEAGQLEEVIVTAERREENIRKVPSSISTVSGEDLDVLATGGQDLRMLAGRIPSLNVESSFGRAYPRFYIRGYGNGDFRLNASQPVSLIYDEVVQENPILKGFPIFDLDQIEVLRGPQGTLFGRNTPGGVVKFDSVKPSADYDTGGYVNISEATYNTANFEGAVSFRLSDNWSARVSGLYQHRDAYVSNSLVSDEEIYEGYNDRAARGQLLYETDTFSALFNVHVRNLDGTARLFRANIIESGSNDLVDGFDSDTISIDGDNDQELENLGGSVQLSWDFGDLALYSITGYESLEVYSRGDIDGGWGCGFCEIPNGPGFVPFPSETADGIPNLDQLTQEFRLESQLDGPFNWQAGVYYFDEDYDTEFFSYDSVFAGGAQTQYLLANQTNTAWAVFGSIRYEFGDAFEMRAGVRYTKDDKDFFTGEPEGFTFPDGAITSASLSDDNVSWDLSGSFAVTEDVNLYARIATGFRGASVQPAGPFGGQSVAEPETNTSYEAGVKADLFDRRAKIYFNLFHYEVKDQQITAVGGAVNAVRLLNAEKTVGQGAELDFQAYLTDNLLMTLGASYNDTEIQDDGISVGVCLQCTVTDPLVDVDPDPEDETLNAVIDGNPLPQAPEIITNFTLRYGHPVGSGELFVYTDWAYRSEVNFFLYESTEFTGKELLEGGLRVGYNWNEGKYELAAFGRNITDEEIAVGAIDFNNLTGFLNEPQIWGIQFKATF